LALMIHSERYRGLLKMRKGAQRHLAAALEDR
jgi:hypothetical protein